jgi:hypothetical protein
MAEFKNLDLTKIATLCSHHVSACGILQAISKLEIAKLPLHDIYVQANSHLQNIFRGINL